MFLFGLTKQEVVVADSSAPARITLWENDINSLEEDQCNFFPLMNVRSFKDEKYLTKPRDSPIVEPIQDMGEVAEDDLPQETTTLSGVEIIGVQSLQHYSACIACDAKVHHIEDGLASCSKCSMVMPLNKCKEKVPANLYLQHGENYLTLSAFDEILHTLIEHKEITAISLINSRPATVTYNNNNIIVSVEI